MNNQNFQNPPKFENNMLMNDLEFPKPGETRQKSNSPSAAETKGEKEHLLNIVECKRMLDSKETNNNEKLKILTEEPFMKKTIQNIILNGMVKPKIPVLQIQAHPINFNGNMIDLMSSDIEKIFSKYGKVTRVETNGSIGRIWFESLISSLMAQIAFNNYKIKELGIIFKVKFLKEEDLKEPIQTLNRNFRNTRKGSTFSTGNTTSVMFLKNNQKLIKIQANNISSSKLTCRYDIQINNDKEFQVAKKIIGAKGCNMKHIIDMTLNNTHYDRRVENDLIKLRLRGKGSGFKEGPAKKESEEPLHLCVSAKYFNLYEKSCVLVEELLTKIYGEYKNYCKAMKIVYDPDMAIKKIECFNPKNPEINDPMLLKQQKLI